MDQPKLRLYVEADLSVGAQVALSADQAHYVTNVMRSRPGDAVALFNGRDGEWRSEIVQTAKHSCILAVEGMLRPQKAEPDVWLVFAPIKKARIDFIAEKATELGVSGLWPVYTRHTIVSRVNSDRLAANAVEAAEQTERMTIPAIFEPETLDKVLASWPPERHLLYMDETGGGGGISEVLPRLTPAPAAVLIGPEGGFAKSELDALRKLPFATAVGLGPRILRADTAALAALACWQALCGDWHERPAFRSSDHQ